MLSRILHAPGFILGTLIAIGIVHAILIFFGFYYHAEPEIDRVGLDSALHLLGGAWIAALFFYAAFRAPHVWNAANYPVLSLLAALAAAALAGVLWEFFEFFLDAVFGGGSVFPRQQGGLIDTISDLVFDETGAFLGSLLYLYALRRR